jgi:hypothetical protein
LHGFDRGGRTNIRGVESRAAAYGANSYTRNSYASYGTGSGYGRGYGRGYRYGAYAAAAAAGYGYGRSYSSSEDGCYYVSTSNRYGHRRVLVCNRN